MQDTVPDLDPDLFDHLLDELAATLPAGAGDLAARRRTARAAVMAMKPADTVGVMLAMQAVAAHYAAMDAFRRAAAAEDERLAARLRNNATGLARMMRVTLKAVEARRAAAAASRPSSPDPLPAGSATDADDAPAYARRGATQDSGRAMCSA
jgi:hypothetical protein